MGPGSQKLLEALAYRILKTCYKYAIINKFQKPIFTQLQIYFQTLKQTKKKLPQCTKIYKPTSFTKYHQNPISQCKTLLLLTHARLTLCVLVQTLTIHMGAIKLKDKGQNIRCNTFVLFFHPLEKTDISLLHLYTIS